MATSQIESPSFPIRIMMINSSPFNTLLQWLQFMVISKEYEIQHEIIALIWFERSILEAIHDHQQMPRH